MSIYAVDLVNVVSGPAGYAAAVYAARAGLAPVMFAGSVTAGGALMTATEVENFPGLVDGVQAPEIMESMRPQAERFGTRILSAVAIRLCFTGHTKNLEQLATEFAGRVKVVNVDADTNPAAVTAAGVTSMPKLGFYRAGERVDILIGAHPKLVIAAKMEELLA